MLDAEDVRRAAREAISEAIKATIKDDDPLVSSGLIDSLSILKLISSLERNGNTATSWDSKPWRGSLKWSQG